MTTRHSNAPIATHPWQRTHGVRLEECDVPLRVSVPVARALRMGCGGSAVHPLAGEEGETGSKAGGRGDSAGSKVTADSGVVASHILEELLSQGIIPEGRSLEGRSQEGRSQEGCHGAAYSITLEGGGGSVRRPPARLEALRAPRPPRREEVDEKMRLAEERRQVKENELKARLRRKSARVRVQAPGGGGGGGQDGSLQPPPPPDLWGLPPRGIPAHYVYPQAFVQPSVVIPHVAPAAAPPAASSPFVDYGGGAAYAQYAAAAAVATAAAYEQPYPYAASPAAPGYVATPGYGYAVPQPLAAATPGAAAAAAAFGQYQQQLQADRMQ
ncbi:unnamed protein product [Menidia menidia]|uniref:(Atlantic silverside) hypothetical protein n=1 Tax=Menidia menidia TaxID=238744 RepID=A0A8S4AUL3_9TELE|nr:unnamed protein product [Menidia menidia]